MCSNELVSDRCEVNAILRERKHLEYLGRCCAIFGAALRSSCMLKQNPAKRVQSMRLQIVHEAFMCLDTKTSLSCHLVSCSFKPRTVTGLSICYSCHDLRSGCTCATYKPDRKPATLVVTGPDLTNEFLILVLL